MIVLDTNVLSELMKPEASEAVVAWTSAQERASVFTTVITLAEIMYGIEIMPPGRRREARLQLATEIFQDDLADRVLPFDPAAALAFATIVAARRRAGTPIQPLDGQIAAIARANGMAVATRNVRDFADCGVDLINPWEA